MHEIGLCEGVLGVALDAAGGGPVRRVRLRVGRLQGVVPEVFDQAWEMVSEGTPAAGSRVQLVDVAVQVRCRACGQESEADEAPFDCRHCGSPDVEVIAGDELVVEEVELAAGELRRNPTLVASEEGV
ncbi:MAG: hydrogenase maturation nickel metallochaperone HypA [Acidimicrobiia bacterium]|nr:hydrogenase maturation nickel metallochaperone HypA [Acidimicrobiia bacterium]